MIYVIARQKVGDFATWRSVFDSHADARKRAGLKVERVLRNREDQNDVFVLSEVTDIEKARGFVSSPDVPEAKSRSGVIGDTEIYFLS